jgi:hypothetical protein
MRRSPLASGPLHLSRDLRGIPLWLLREYLFELGGAPGQEEGQVEGPGWRACLEQIEPFQVGSLVVGQVRLEVEMDPHAAGAFQEALEKKLLRAGG